MLRGRNRSFAAQGGQDVRYRTLGHTGLIVSEVALGSMQFGGQMNMGNLGQDETNRMVNPKWMVLQLDTAEDPRSKILHPERYAEGGPWKDLRGTQWSS
jgi:hypothetical protein